MLQINTENRIIYLDKINFSQTRTFRKNWFGKFVIFLELLYKNYRTNNSVIYILIPFKIYWIEIRQNKTFARYTYFYVEATNKEIKHFFCERYEKFYCHVC